MTPPAPVPAPLPAPLSFVGLVLPEFMPPGLAERRARMPVNWAALGLLERCDAVPETNELVQWVRSNCEKALRNAELRNQFTRHPVRTFLCTLCAREALEKNFSTVFPGAPGSQGSLAGDGAAFLASTLQTALRGGTSKHIDSIRGMVLRLYVDMHVQSLHGELGRLDAPSGLVPARACLLFALLPVLGYADTLPRWLSLPAGSASLPAGSASLPTSPLVVLAALLTRFPGSVPGFEPQEPVARCLAPPAGEPFGEELDKEPGGDESRPGAFHAWAVLRLAGPRHTATIWKWLGWPMDRRVLCGLDAARAAVLSTPLCNDDVLALLRVFV